MPIYIFKNPKTSETIEVFQNVNDEHIYLDGDGLSYERVYTSPNVSVDSQIDPFSSKDFIEKTRNKKGTIGDLWDKSKELSEKRGGLNDPVKNKFFSDYEKKHGVKHTDQPRKSK